MLELLYEGRDVQVLGRRAGETAVITFSPGNSDGIPFADKLLLKAGMTAVHFVAPRNHWWQSSEMSEATASVCQFLEGINDRVTYGASMGGYGALAWAKAVGATRILAIAPQTTLSGGLKPNWQQSVTANGVVRDALPDDLPAEVVPVLVYDPLSSTDEFHAQWLGARRKIARVRTPGTGHNVLKSLRALGIGTAVLGPFLKGEMSADTLQCHFDHSCTATGAVVPV